MKKQRIIAFITMSLLISPPCLASADDQHHEVVSENAITLVANFLKNHHDEVKRNVVATSPFGEGIDYEQLSSGQQEQLDHFIKSQLIMEAQQSLPFSMGEILAASMYIYCLEDLDENSYKEAYHDHGISDLQIKKASLLIRKNFHLLRTKIQENADVSRIPRKHQVNFLIQALGEEIIDLLQTSMKIDLASAIEIYTYLQRLERINALQKQEEVKRNMSNGITAYRPSHKKKNGLILSTSFIESDIPRSQSHMEKHWQTYALITGGLGIAALLSFFEPETN